MKLGKRGFNQGTVEKYMNVLLTVIVFLILLAAIFPTMVGAGNNLSNAGFPFASFFQSGGLMWIILALSIVILLFKAFFKSSK